MRIDRPRLLLPLLALFAISCEKSTTTPPDGANCGTSVAEITIGVAPGSSNQAGTLTTASCKLGRGSYADRYKFVLGVNADVDIVVHSDDFDAFLILRDEGDNGITSDDDFGPGSDARLHYSFSAGTYYILATTYEDDIVGDYTVTIIVTSL